MLSFTMFEPKFIGNCKRIEEFAERGLERTAIVSEFHQRGIDISINMVNAVLDGDVQEMKTKALPKQAIKDLDADIARISQGIIA